MVDAKVKQGGKAPEAGTSDYKAERDDKVKQGGKAPETETPDYKAERDELMQATQQFFRSLFRAGVQVALVPMNMLPPEPREHFKVAGREFTRGVATLVQEIANDVEKLVEEGIEEQVRD